MFNPDARKWFGDHYRFLIDQGIEYILYDDDGFSKDYGKENYRVMKY